MKEFQLTQSYATIREMLDSDEMAIYNDELMEGEIDEYAIISRIGNHYDIDGNKINGYVKNPYIKASPMSINDFKEEAKTMKYTEIEKVIDEEIAKAIAEANVSRETMINEIRAEHENALNAVKIKHEEELTSLRNYYEAKLTEMQTTHAEELSAMRENIKAEFIAKLNY